MTAARARGGVGTPAPTSAAARRAWCSSCAWGGLALQPAVRHVRSESRCSSCAWGSTRATPDRPDERHLPDPVDLVEGVEPAEGARLRDVQPRVGRLRRRRQIPGGLLQRPSSPPATPAGPQVAHAGPVERPPGALGSSDGCWPSEAATLLAPAGGLLWAVDLDRHACGLGLPLRGPAEVQFDPTSRR